MGDCVHCRKPAGFMRKKHKECSDKFSAGYDKVLQFATGFATGKITLPDAFEFIKKIAIEHYIRGESLKSILEYAWIKSVDEALSDNIISTAEEIPLSAYLEVFHLDPNTSLIWSAKDKLEKGIMLREITNGNLTDRRDVEPALPFNFLKEEKLIWVYSHVWYSEQVVYRQYVGRANGLSIRVAKGVYYRTSAFKGNPVDMTAIKHVDTGYFAITDQHLYFHGPYKSFRIPYRKIVSLQPYDDGIGIQQDKANSKPQIFTTGDGWFTVNLIANLSRI